jgi:hypothetical protein
MNNDTPSFRDIATESVAEVKVEATTETPEVQPTATEEPTEATQEEVFAEKTELKGRTPEQMEEIYQNWQKAYTAKRQKETQELKEYQAKLAELEKKVVQPQTQQNADVNQLAQDAREQVELGQMSVQQYTEYIKQLMVEEAREVARQEYQSFQAAEREEQLANTALEQFQSVDARLNENAPNYDESFKNEVQRELAELLDEHLNEKGSYQGFDAQTLTKQIVERRDAQLDEIIKKRTIQSTQAAKMREAKAKKSEVRGSTQDGQSIGGNSIRSILSEAVDSAA